MKKSKNQRLEKTKNTALSSLMAAACFILMYFSSLTGVLDLCAVVVCAMIIIVSVIEIRGYFPWLIWLVSGVLCLIFIPDKFVALEFFMFGGLYPMVKAYLERLPAFIAWAMKFTFFNVVLTGAFLISKYLFAMNDVGFSLSIPAYILANIFFIVSDVAFTLMISIYMIKIRPRLRPGKKHQ